MTVEKRKINVENSFRVLGSRCIVREVKNSSQTEAGLILPGAEKQQTNHGIVIVVGDGAILENGTTVPMKVKPGDHVLYSSFSGAPVKVNRDDDENFLILNERDIYCIYDPKE